MHDGMMFNGLELISTSAITKKVQARTHRKRRINKKWLKRYGYKTVPDDTKLIITGSCVYGSPRAIKRLIAKVKEEEQKALVDK